MNTITAQDFRNEYGFQPFIDQFAPEIVVFPAVHVRIAANLLPASLGDHRHGVDIVSVLEFLLAPEVGVAQPSLLAKEFELGIGGAKAGLHQPQQSAERARVQKVVRVEHEDRVRS